jgi:hypothetical protein
MIDLRNALELLNWGRQVIGDMTQMTAVPWLDPFWAAVVAVVLGLALALWGGRILRTGVILAFMAAGAVWGKRMAGSMQVDLLIGLVIGAGVAGLIGYVFYRWWLGLTIGTVAALVVAITFSAPKMLNERQAFDDYRLGMGTGRYDTVHRESYSVDDVRNYFWTQRRDFVVRSLLPVMVIGVIAFAATMLAPRLAAVLGTSILGVLLLACGTGALLASKWQDWWNSIQAHQGWVLCGLSVFWLFSFMYQLTHPSRPRSQVVLATTVPPGV